jgi:hypothetical protein
LDDAAARGVEGGHKEEGHINQKNEKDDIN